ncbi:hypothetical protein AMTR_s00015p00257710 [Amborella trichopoda]|uniref:Chitinase domain-containing protein 1 n=1 Tax=Amborella trichopoda TaxID=13333 RepID=W1PLM1_AMBTC|nr:hypothetical protein AMTR_s00015p00257710 [Amborella trichopoda]
MVLPSVALEASPVKLLTKKKQWLKAIDLIVSECKDLGYDGIVLESWSLWANYGVLQDQDMRKKALEFIKQLGLALHLVRLKQDSDCSLQLVYVIGPPNKHSPKELMFSSEDFEYLIEAVDGFSLMTYDFSSAFYVGPNAPLYWVRAVVQFLAGNNESLRSLAHKVFVGINFYGNDFVLPQGMCFSDIEQNLL